MVQAVNNLFNINTSNIQQTKNNSNTNFDDIFKFKLSTNEYMKYRDDAEKEYKQYKDKGITDRDSNLFWNEYFTHKIDDIRIYGKGNKWENKTFEDFKKTIQIFPPIGSSQSVLDNWEKALSNYSPNDAFHIQREFNIKATNLSDKECTNIFNDIKRGSNLDDVLFKISMPLNSSFRYK